MSEENEKKALEELHVNLFVLVFFVLARDDVM
jgi:hypothetical protein